MKEFKEYLKNLLDNGFIINSILSWGDPILSLKKDGSLRMCIEYGQFNKVIVNNKYPIPRINDLFKKLQSASWIFKVDLRSKYHQV